MKTVNTNTYLAVAPLRHKIKAVKTKSCCAINNFGKDIEQKGKVKTSYFVLCCTVQL